MTQPSHPDATTITDGGGGPDRHVVVDGVRLAYQVHGDGAPVVLLHGTGGPKEHWLPQWVPALVRAGRRVVIVDSRGAGSSDAPPPPYTVAGMAADIAGLIVALDLEPCAVVGYSLGGILVEELIAARPELMSAAVMIAAARPASAYSQLTGDALIEIVTSGIELPAAARATRTLGQLLTPAQLSDDTLVTALYERLVAAPPWAGPGRDGQLAATRTALLDDPRPSWSRVSTPLLVVAFDQDSSAPVGSARAMAGAVRGAELVVVEGAGHGGAFTHAPEVVAHVADFLGRRAADRGGAARTPVAGAAK